MELLGSSNFYKICPGGSDPPDFFLYICIRNWGLHHLLTKYYNTLGWILFVSKQNYLGHMNSKIK